MISPGTDHFAAIIVCGSTLSHPPPFSSSVNLFAVMFFHADPWSSGFVTFVRFGFFFATPPDFPLKKNAPQKNEPSRRQPDIVGSDFKISEEGEEKMNQTWQFSFFFNGKSDADSAERRVQASWCHSGSLGKTFRSRADDDRCCDNQSVASLISHARRSHLTPPQEVQLFIIIFFYLSRSFFFFF